MINNIAIYTRSSTNYQAKGLQAQERAVLEYCERNGFNNTTIFQDEGISGKKASRPSFDLMLKDVKNGTTTCVVTYSLSRIARNTKNLLETLELFQSLNVRFISISESIDTKNSMAKILLTILGAVAEFEADLVSSRVKTGLDNARSKGVQLGRPKKRNSILIRELKKQGYSYRRISELSGASLATISRELSL